MKRIVISVVTSGVMAAGLTACGGGGSAEDFCSLEERFSAFEQGDLEGVQTALEDAVEAAPDEIKDDVETVANATRDLLDQAEEAGIDFSDPSSLQDADPEAAQQLQEAAEQLDTGEVAEASDRVSAWVEENCGSSE